MLNGGALVKRRARKPVVVGIVCILVILIAILFKFVLISEERRIELTLRGAIEAVRNEDLAGCMDHIASSGWDTPHVTREELEYIIQEGFDSFDNIRVLYDEFSVAVEGDRAIVSVKVKVIAKYDDQVMILLGTLTEGREVELDMLKEGKSWLISSIRGVDIPTEILEEL